MKEKKGFKLTDELIREALDRDLAAIDAPPADQMWPAIEARLEGKTFYGRRKPVSWRRLSAVAAVFCLLVISGIILSRAVEMPSPASDLVIIPIEPFKEVAVLEVEDESLDSQEKAVTFEQPQVADQPVKTDQPTAKIEPEAPEKSVLIEEAELPDKLQTAEKPAQPERADADTEKDPAEQPESSEEHETTGEPADLEKPVQTEIADQEKSPDQPEKDDKAVISMQPEAVSGEEVEIKPDQKVKESEGTGDLESSTKPEPEKKPEKAPSDWPSSLPGGYQYTGMVDLKGKAVPLYMAAIYRSDSVDLLLVRSEPSDEALTVFADRLSKKMQVLLADGEDDLSAICPDLKTCSGLAWEKNGRNQALLVLFGTLEEEELLNILVKLE